MPVCNSSWRWKAGRGTLWAFVMGVTLMGLLGCTHNDTDQAAPASGATPGDNGTITLDNATAEQFYRGGLFTTAQRVDWADSQLRSPSTDTRYPNMTVEQAAYQRVKDSSVVPIGDLAEPSVSNTAGEIAAQNLTVRAAALYEIGLGGRGLDWAEKVLAATEDRSTDLRVTSATENLERISKGTPSQSDLYQRSVAYNYTPFDPNKAENVPQWTALTTEGPIGSSIFPENGEPTRVSLRVHSRTSDEIPDYEVVLAFVSNKRWIERERMGPHDLYFIEPSRLAGL